MTENTITEPTIQLHTSIKTLKLSAFIACVVKKDYTQLIIEGEPTENELFTAWVNIISEYHEARKDAASTVELENNQDRRAFENKKYRVTLIIEMLRKHYHADLVEELVIDGYEYDYAPETYLDDLIKVEAELQSEESYLIPVNEEIQAKEPSEAAYITTLIKIQRVLKACPMMTPKQMIDNLTAYEYVEYCNEYDNYILSKQPTEKTEEDEH